MGLKPSTTIHREGPAWQKAFSVFSSQRPFAFASEIKALLQLPNIERKVNDIAIHHYLTYQYIPSPDTIFEGIKKLPLPTTFFMIVKVTSK